MSEFMRSEFDSPSFPDVMHDDYYNENTDFPVSYQNQMPTIDEEESEPGVDNFIPPSTFDNKYSWNYVENEQKLREQKYKVTFKNRIKEAEYFIDKINKTHNAIKTELKQDKITNKYKNLVEEDMEGLSSSRIEKFASKVKIRGYGNILQKSKEDLIQLVHNMKEQINDHQNEIHFLKVKIQRMRLNRDEETGIIIRKIGEKRRPLAEHLVQSQTFLSIPKDKESLDEHISLLK